MHIKNFLSRAQDKFSIDRADMPMLEWICKNTSLKGKPFSVEGFEFQEEIVNDMHPDLYVIKCSQIGLTEVQIRKALGFLRRYDGTSLIYSLPTEDMFKRISKARVKPIVDKDKVFNTEYDKINKSTRSADMMQFGQSFLYITPAIESAATSIDADFIMNDEIDLSDQSMISLFNSRLQGSKWRISQKFSTPSFPKYSVDLSFQSTDQKHYKVQCACCNHWQHPEFNKKFIHIPGLPEDIVQLTDILEEHQDIIDLHNSYVKCEKCHERLDLDDPKYRQWVEKYPGRSSRGYRITPFCTGNLDPQYIITQMWKYQQKEYMRGFHNTVLGMPYSDGSMQVAEEDIEACMVSERDLEPNDYEDVWVGIDMGQTCHVFLGKGPNCEHLFKMFSCHVDDLIPKVKEICEKYNVRGGAVDRHPYEPTARDVWEASGYKIVPTEYRGQKETNLVLDEYEELKHVQVNRTLFLDRFAVAIRKHMLKISGYGYNKKVLIEHIRDMIRDEKPDEPAVWIKLNNNDHYFHAGAFCMLGPEIARLWKLKSNADKREHAVTQIVTTKDHTSNLIGMTKNSLVD